MLKQEFDAWWDGDDLTTDNPFKEETPAYWAWEGWVAGVKVEREACAKECEAIGEWERFEYAEAIRARSEE